MNSVIDLIVKLLSGFVDGFKMKNPVAFTVIAAALGIAYYGLGTLLDSVLPGGGSLLNEATQAIVETVRGIIVTVLAILGAHTPSPKPPNVKDSVSSLEAKFAPEKG